MHVIVGWPDHSISHRQPDTMIDSAVILWWLFVSIYCFSLVTFQQATCKLNQSLVVSLVCLETHLRSEGLDFASVTLLTPSLGALPD
jgi:hypothetical protein